MNQSLVRQNLNLRMHGPHGRAESELELGLDFRVTYIDQ